MIAFFIKFTPLQRGLFFPLYSMLHQDQIAVFYNGDLCRASPSEFVIPLAKYYKSNYGQQVSPGMRFRMMFETEESGTRR